MDLHDEFDLSFVVVFAKISNQSYLRVFHHNNIINEVACTSLVSTINVPLEYQDDIQFEFHSDDYNSCHFFAIGMTNKLNRSVYRQHFLLFAKSSDKPELDEFNFIPYNGSWFGKNIIVDHLKGKTLHSKSTLTFASQLRRVRAPDDVFSISPWNRAPCGPNYWINDLDNKQFVPIFCHWIARFKPGIACFYRYKRHKYYSLPDFPRLNIFKGISFDAKNDQFYLTKFSNAVITVPSDRYLGSKKIYNEIEYLDFIRQALFILPGLIKHAHHL